MKAFFILILLTNIVFALLQWLMPYEQVFSRATPIVAAEQLRLLSEVKTQSEESATDTTVDLQIDEADIPSVEKKLCYTLGPFKNEQTAQQVIDLFRQQDIDTTSRPSQEKEYMGMMVYIDGHNNRQQAVNTAEALAERGVSDYMIVNEEDKNYALSLGVFGLKKNADRRVKRISALGYKVKSEPRYRNRRIFWLDYDEPENEALEEVVSQLKSEQGISRISRACS